MAWTFVSTETTRLSAWKEMKKLLKYADRGISFELCSDLLLNDPWKDAQKRRKTIHCILSLFQKCFSDSHSWARTDSAKKSGHESCIKRFRAWKYFQWNTWPFVTFAGNQRGKIKRPQNFRQFTHFFRIRSTKRFQILKWLLASRPTLNSEHALSGRFITRSGLS